MVFILTIEQKWIFIELIIQITMFWPYFRLEERNTSVDSMIKQIFPLSDIFQIFS